MLEIPSIVTRPQIARATKNTLRSVSLIANNISFHLHTGHGRRDAAVATTLIQSQARGPRSLVAAPLRKRNPEISEASRRGGTIAEMGIRTARYYNCRNGKKGCKTPRRTPRLEGSIMIATLSSLPLPDALNPVRFSPAKAAVLEPFFGLVSFPLWYGN